MLLPGLVLNPTVRRLRHMSACATAIRTTNRHSTSSGVDRDKGCFNNAAKYYDQQLCETPLLGALDMNHSLIARSIELLVNSIPEQLRVHPAIAKEKS